MHFGRNVVGLGRRGESASHIVIFSQFTWLKSHSILAEPMVSNTM